MVTSKSSNSRFSYSISSNSYSSS